MIGGTSSDDSTLGGKTEVSYAEGFNEKNSDRSMGGGSCVRTFRGAADRRRAAGREDLSRRLSLFFFSPEFALQSLSPRPTRAELRRKTQRRALCSVC